jgi:hypothetical protein
MTLHASQTYRLLTPRLSPAGTFTRLADAKAHASSLLSKGWAPLRWKKVVVGGLGVDHVSYVDQSHGYEIIVDEAAQPNPSAPYHLSVLPPKDSKFWNHDREVVVFDEPRKGTALVRLHDLLIDPELHLIGTQVFLQIEDARGKWVNLVHYVYKGCRRGWEKKLQ